MGGEAPANAVHGRLVSTEVWVIGMRKRAFGPEGACRGRYLAALVLVALVLSMASRPAGAEEGGTDPTPQEPVVAFVTRSNVEPDHGPITSSISTSSVVVAYAESVPPEEIHDEASSYSDLVFSVHQCIVLGIVVTVGYVVYAVLRRVLFFRRLEKYESILAEDDDSDSSGFSDPDENDTLTTPEDASGCVFVRQIEQARGERPL